MFSMAIATKPRTKRGEQRRAEILAAAEQVFGTKGYSDASVAEITTVARTAQGTLYIYFSGKDEIFTELVREMGRMTRAKVGRAVAGASGRLDAERRGLAAFLRIAAERPALYRIVEEARFVAPEAYRSYFEDFARAYRLHLDEAVAEGGIRPGDNEVRAWALMGMAKTLGERFILWGRETDIDRIVDHAIDMIDHGLRAK
ncbi:TetR/AcrR family transcriptional regulator [Frigidibacter sp. ROC022]|uniref:TetR/AcrR family transcriptional regulator n=1 Tax=Frigidibacter sp. ROC022 TaxID=2971796 RepID=UPI00215AB1FC|nr:TetR/AcrR family transcriptional regulator [Frigidibacter sp. ROC022]MCR8724706.1 TetR/AcrR family transcriptional regulator [Frigidibacter sp. ROC022]